MAALKSIFIFTFNNHIVYLLGKIFSVSYSEIFSLLLVIYVHYYLIQTHFMGLTKWGFFPLDKL